MGTVTHSQSSVETLDNQLNQAILSGDILGAFEKFYAEDVVMQENFADPFVGKESNRKREQEFLNSVEQFHSVKLVGSAVNGDRSYSEWEFEITFKGGNRVTMREVASRLWKNGQVSHERFYYKG